MPGNLMWLYDEDAGVWKPALCDTNGKIRISDVDPFEVVQDTPQDLTHLPHGYYAAGPSYLPIKVKADGTICVELGSLAHLNDIGDVNVAAPTDGYVLYWDNAASEFKLKAILSSKIVDADGDTSWDTEQAADEDKIHGKVKGVEAFLLDDAGVLTLAKQSRARAYQTSEQSIPAATETKVALNIEDYDEQSEYDHVTNYRFTAKTAGYYLVCGNAVFSTLADGKKYVVGAKKNATTWVGVGRGIIGGTEAAGASFSGVIYLAVGNYLEMWVYHDDTVARALNATVGYNQMAVHKLS